MKSKWILLIYLLFFLSASKWKTEMSLIQVELNAPVVMIFISLQFLYMKEKLIFIRFFFS